MAIILRDAFFSNPWRREGQFYFRGRTWAPTASGIYVPAPAAACYTFRDSDVSETGSTTVTFNFNLGGPSTSYVFCAIYQQNGGSYTVQVNGQNLTLLLDAQPSAPGTVTLWGGSVSLGSDPNSITWTVSGGAFTVRILHVWTITASNTTPLDIHSATDTTLTTIVTLPESGDAILAGAWFLANTSSNFSGSTATPAGDRAEVGSGAFGMTTADWTSAISSAFSAISANTGGHWIARWRCEAAADFIPGQYNYPAPPRPLEHYQIPERQIGLNLSLLSVPRPSSLFDWPRPLVLAFRSDLSWTARNIALLTPAEAAAEFIPSQYDYPQPPQLPWPMSARTWLQRGILVVPTNPFVQEDWPAPQRPPIAYARAVSAFIPLLHSVKPPNAQDDWPLPVQPYRVYARSSAPSLALTAAQPFALEDWPQPKRPPIVYAPAQGAYIALLHSIKPPIAQTDWPQPVRPYIVRSISYSTGATLLGVTPTPFVKSDWPLPIRPAIVYSPSVAAQALQLTPLPLVPVYDYLSPLRVPVPTLGWIQRSILEVAAPFNLEDWPLPKLPPIVYSPAIGANIKLLHSIKPPIAQTDWPQPIKPYRVYATSYSMGPTVLGVTPVPFVETDWPGPIPPYRVYAEARSAFHPLLHSVKPPNAQDDWPIPIQPGRVYAEVRRAPIGLLHSIKPPIAQTDWPTPTPPFRVYATSYSIPQTVLTPPIPPFPRLYDWPGPIPPYRVYAEVRRADISLLHSIKPPNAQTDWPLPKRAPTAGLTWISATAALLQPQAPFAQDDWPLPRLAFVPPSLRTWIPRSLALLGEAIPVGQSDWPTPRRLPGIPAKHFPLANAIILAATTRPPNAHVAWPQPIRPPVPPSRHFPLAPGIVALALTKPFKQDHWPKPWQISSYRLPSTADNFGTWVGTVTPAPVARFPTEGRFRSPLQADDARPGVPDHRRPGQSDIRRGSNESPSSARDRSWRYEE